MARWAILLGLVLLLIGIFAYTGGNHTSAALLPAYFGILLGVMGTTARSENEKTRMIAMHIAAVVAVVGFLMTVGSVWDYAQMQHGVYTPHPKIVQQHAEAAVILLVFLVLSVLSFIRARRAREAGATGKAVGSRSAR
jgi:hypothetical protein